MNYLVINSAFNRAHFNNLIGQTFERPPGYAQVQFVDKPQHDAHCMDYATELWHELLDAQQDDRTDNMVIYDIHPSTE